MLKYLAKVTLTPLTSWSKINWDLAREKVL